MGLMLVLGVIGYLMHPTMVSAITLKGANGREVDFHAVKSAAPGGLTVQMSADSADLEVPWTSFDLADLEKQHPDIHAAYERAKVGETIDLTEKKAEKDKEKDALAAPKKSAPAKYEGWLDTKIGNISFMIQVPKEEVRGILLISFDDFGDSFKWAEFHKKGTGQWGIFQTKFGMALLAYNADRSNRNPTKLEDFVHSEAGSGKALMTALGNFATQLDQPALANAPIAVLARGRTGAAFAFNFVQEYPERILAASLYDGGFYDATPTEASAKVPMLLMWGQYSNRQELWGSTSNSVEVLAKVASMKTCWTNGREFRGQGTLTPENEYFARQYLLTMIEERLPKAEDAAASGAPELAALNRGSGSVGNVLTGEVSTISSADADLGEDETFLPNATVIRYWKGFVTGTLEIPE